MESVLTTSHINESAVILLHNMTLKPILIVLRGNSGSGKSSVAQALRQYIGYGLAWIEQDYIRRILLREPDQAHAVNIELIAMNVRFALKNNYHVVLEGILDAERYGAMLQSLYIDYTEQSFFYYFDLSFTETVRRHATRPQSQDFSAEMMQSWYKRRDFLSFTKEKIIQPEDSLESIVKIISCDTGLYHFNKSTC